MRYPITKTARARLTRLYYELSLIPGIEPRVLRSWADMLSRLICNKPDSRRKLDAQDLQLPWRPLWHVLQKELWPKKRLHDSSYVYLLCYSFPTLTGYCRRNVVNILLFVAEQCKRYYPPSEIPDMLSAFLPLLTKDVRASSRCLLMSRELMSNYSDCLDDGTGTDVIPAAHTHTPLPSNGLQALGGLQFFAH